VIDGRVQNEVNGDLTAVIRQNSSARLWQLISLILGLIIAGGTILSVVGKAFYVTRTEYTERVLEESLKQDRLSQSLDTLRTAINSLEITVKQDAEAIGALKIELARTKHQ
jgi:outer membrane murein-binding lipoprotein Lpp